MKRTVVSAVLVFGLGLVGGTFLVAPLVTPAPATAQEKKPAEPDKKAKCVGVTCTTYGKDMMMISRAFEDGTVEISKMSVYSGVTRWEPSRK